MEQGKQTRDFVYVKDVARANLQAVKSDVIGAVNISTGREITINETFFIIKQHNRIRPAGKTWPCTCR